MKIGDVLFDVSQGMPCGFLQQLVGINLQSNQYYQLGEVSKRMIVSPDMTGLDK